MAKTQHFTDVDDAIGFIVEEIVLNKGTVVVDIEGSAYYEDFAQEVFEELMLHGRPEDTLRLSWIHDSIPGRATAVVVLR